MPRGDRCNCVPPLTLASRRLPPSVGPWFRNPSSSRPLSGIFRAPAGCNQLLIPICNAAGRAIETCDDPLFHRQTALPWCSLFQEPSIRRSVPAAPPRACVHCAESPMSRRICRQSCSTTDASILRRRSTAMFGQTSDHLTDLDGIEDDGTHGHAAAVHPLSREAVFPFGHTSAPGRDCGGQSGPSMFPVSGRNTSHNGGNRSSLRYSPRRRVRFWAQEGQRRNLPKVRA